jgi:hypothetical protein
VRDDAGNVVTEPVPTEKEVDVALTHQETSALLRLTYAVVYARIQGRTVADKHVVLLDTRHRHFDVRTLIVGLSRVEMARFVHVPLPMQEVSLMREVRDAPEPPANLIEEPGEHEESDVSDSEEEEIADEDWE